MAKDRVKDSGAITSSTPLSGRLRKTGKATKPVARTVHVDGRRLLVLENALYRVAVWPEMGGAITSYVDRATNLDVIWRNPRGQPARTWLLDQPEGGGSDLFDVMDGSWFVSLPTGFFPCDYFGAPVGTHGELRSVPWSVEDIQAGPAELRVVLTGHSVRTPFRYRRELTVRRDSARMHWRETVENRAAEPLPVAWLQHPAFGGPLLEGARLIAPAKTVRVFRPDDPATLQLEAGYSGRWPLVPERLGGAMRDCSVVPPAGSGRDHSVQLTDFEAGWGCVWNEQRQLGFGLEWDHQLFPYAWSWNSAGGVAHYPLWGEGHLVTLQPSTSPVGHWGDLLRSGEVLQIPARGAVTTTLTTGFVTTERGPWPQPEAGP